MQKNRPSLRALFACSARELRRTRTIALTGVLLAAQVVLCSYGSLRLTETLRVSLDHLALAPTAMLFGPAAAAAQGALCDVIAYLLRPEGAYFPGFTLSKLLLGAIYGAALYKVAKPGLARVALTRLAVAVLLNILLNTLFLTMLYGPAKLYDLPVRVLKNLLQWPVDCLLLAAVCRLVGRLPTMGEGR